MQSGEQVTAVDGQGNWLRTNVYVAGAAFATYDNTGVLHFNLSDALGTKRVQVNATGVVEQTCQSLPFGDQLSCSGADDNKLHFTAKERDTESGNDYFGARYLSSSMGRFLSPDWSTNPSNIPYAVFSNPQSLNLYAYVYNNPLTNVDLDGHHCGQVTVQKDGTMLLNCGNDPPPPPPPPPPPVKPQSQTPKSAKPNVVNNPLKQGQIACKAKALATAAMDGASSALGVSPPGSDPAGDAADAVKNAAKNPVVQASVGVAAERLGAAVLTRAGAERLGAFAADGLVPFAGEAAAAYTGYSALKDASDSYNKAMDDGACAP